MRRNRRRMGICKIRREKHSYSDQNSPEHFINTVTVVDHLWKLILE